MLITLVSKVQSLPGPDGSVALIVEQEIPNLKVEGASPSWVVFIASLAQWKSRTLTKSRPLVQIQQEAFFKKIYKTYYVMY